MEDGYEPYEPAVTRLRQVGGVLKGGRFLLQRPSGAVPAPPTCFEIFWRGLRLPGL